MYLNSGGTFDTTFWAFLFRWLHVLSGIMWIGRFTISTLYKSQTCRIFRTSKSGYWQSHCPAALWWFRWAAATLVTGLILGYINGYIHDALALGAMNDFAVPKNIAIGIGMWLGIIMWFNVWFVICLTRKKPLVLSRPALMKSRFGAHGHAVLAHQHNVVSADAVCHGVRSEYLLSGKKYGGAAICAALSFSGSVNMDEELLRQELRGLDSDLYLCHLFAPAEKRGALLTLYHLYADIARIPASVSDPMVGAIRLHGGAIVDAVANGDGRGTPIEKRCLSIPCPRQGFATD